MADLTKTPAGAIRDLPKGASVTSRSSTSVASLMPTPPRTASVMMAPPAMPDSAVLSRPGAPPSTVLAAVTHALKNPSSQLVPSSPLAGRAQNPTFFAPSAEAVKALAQLHTLRATLGGILSMVDGGVGKAEAILEMVKDLPLVPELALKEGIDLNLAAEMLAALKAFLDKFVPPVPAPTPEPESPPAVLSVPEPTKPSE